MRSGRAPVASNFLPRLAALKARSQQDATRPRLTVQRVGNGVDPARQRSGREGGCMDRVCSARGVALHRTGRVLKCIDRDAAWAPCGHTCSMHSSLQHATRPRPAPSPVAPDPPAGDGGLGDEEAAKQVPEAEEEGAEQAGQALLGGDVDALPRRGNQAAGMGV